MFASPCWWMDLSAADRRKLQAVFDRPCWGLCAQNPLSLLDLCDQADCVLFGAVVTNPTMSSGLFFLSYISDPQYQASASPICYPQEGQIQQAELLEANAILIAGQLMWHSPTYNNGCLFVHYSSYFYFSAHCLCFFCIPVPCTFIVIVCLSPLSIQ